MSGDYAWRGCLSDPSPVPVGARIELIAMRDDPHPIEPGSLGTVRAGSNGAQVKVAWDSGRTLMLIPGEDTWRVLTEPPVSSSARCNE